jgi:hypothetical protein
VGCLSRESLNLSSNPLHYQAYDRFRAPFAPLNSLDSQRAAMLCPNPHLACQSAVSILSEKAVHDQTFPTSLIGTILGLSFGR